MADIGKSEIRLKVEGSGNSRDDFGILGAHRDYAGMGRSMEEKARENGFKDKEEYLKYLRKETEEEMKKYEERTNRLKNDGIEYD
ncbi:MAG: hypothetical protein QXK65_00065 [Candidatus Micrarchaeaceae archaeon]